ncbi:MAG: GntR family transcriptional regulator [Acidobacteriota bacterium]|jgi:GntR family transcriptional regulator
MIFQINPSDPTPLYAQLERAIRSAIATGRLQPDTQLPTVRQLAVDLRINANTVAKVYRDLERAGLVETRRGVGTFVKAPPPDAKPLRERERLLKDFVERFFAEGALHGFGADELLTHLKRRLSKGE